LYADAIAIGSDGFERSLERGAWSHAMLFANLLIEVSRRLLRLDDCFYWARRQLEASMLAGPVLEAEARFMLASVKFVVNRSDEAVEEIRYALPLIEGVRRRNALSTTPTGQLEWMLHHALAHAHNSLGDFETALAESEWLLRSPWTFNSHLSCAQLTSVAIETRLSMDSAGNIAAAKLLLQRIPPAPSGNVLASALDTLARGRVAARDGSGNASGLLRKAFDQFAEVATLHHDQVHRSYYQLAQAARGVDDLLAANATELARKHERLVIEAAGDLWGLTA
jgi:hypothetical protein